MATCAAGPAVILLAALALAACSPDEAIAPGGMQARSPARAASVATLVRPLDGHCATTFGFLAPVPGQAPDVQRLRFDGTCQLSHFGRTAVQADQVVTFGASGSTVTNTASYTAANGDVLRATYSATGTFPDAAGQVCFSGVETYVGGTGRFADATGASHLEGCASVVTFTGAYDLEGTIAY